MEIGSVGYQRHRPEQTLLYQIVERHYPAFADHLAEAGKQLPAHVRHTFDAYLQCKNQDTHEISGRMANFPG